METRQKLLLGILLAKDMTYSYEDQHTISIKGALAVPNLARFFEHQSHACNATSYNKTSANCDGAIKKLTAQAYAKKQAKKYTSYRHHTNPTTT